MILEHDGQSVDFYDKFPRTAKNIGISLSGGLDSSLILYLLVKMIQERNDDDVTIYPIVCYDVDNESIDEPYTVQRIINWIEDYTGMDEIIAPISVTPYSHPSSEKRDVIKANMLYLQRRFDCEFTLTGISLGMPEAPRTGEAPWSADSDILRLHDLHPHRFPWSTVNKKFISAQYKKLGIEELATLTNSCTVSSTTPCKVCWWCEERYWAFNSFDGGVQ